MKILPRWLGFEYVVVAFVQLFFWFKNWWTEHGKEADDSKKQKPGGEPANNDGA